MYRITAYALVCCLLAAGACKEKKKERVIFDYGRVKNRMYHNNYFGFKMPLPAGWNIAPDSELEDSREEGRKIGPNHPPGDRYNYSPDEVSSAPLLELAGPAKEAGFIPFMRLSVHKPPGPVRQYSTASMAAGLQESVTNDHPESRFPWAIHDMKVDGHTASELVAVTDEDGISVTRIFYIFIEKEYVLTFILAFDNDADEERMKDCIQKIKFTK